MEEPKPRRGEIWRVRLNRRRGTEMRGEHPCLIVSADELNEDLPLVTILPITTYSAYKEGIRPLWSVTFQSADGDPNRKDFSKSDVDFDPCNDTYEPPNERLRRTISKVDRQDKEFEDPYKSIIDCAQIWTVSKQFPPEDRRRYELRWDRRHGELKHNKIVQVDTDLQVLLSSDILYRGRLKYRQGDVLIVNLPNMYSQRCIVVSSPGIDAIRELPIRFDENTGTYKPYAHCTVVPLVAAERAQGLLGETLVNVYPNGGAANPTVELAICYQIYTIDWQSREVVRGPVGRVCNRNVDNVSERDMVDLHEALRYCLTLPHLGETNGEETHPH